MKKNTTETLETERLILRPFENDDAEAFFAYASSPNVGPNAGWKPHESVEESEKIIKVFNEEFYRVWAIVLKENDELIGSVGLVDSTKGELIYDKELGYAMSDKHWGKGIMTEAVKKVIDYAFNVLDVQSLIISHFPDNVRSERVIEKCGFRYIITLKENWKNFDGKVLDEACYYLSKEEYLLQK